MSGDEGMDAATQRRSDAEGIAPDSARPPSSASPGSRVASSRRPDLAAMLRREPAVADVSQVASTAPLQGPVLRMVPVYLLLPNPQQARKVFAAGPLNDLAASIRAVGIRQPLLLSPLDDGSGRYLIHAGERRYRAALMVGLSDVPAMIVPAGPQTPAEALADSLLENLQRVELDPLEEAEAFVPLQQEYGFSTRDIARRIGKSQSYVAERIVAHKRLAPAVKQVIIEALSAYQPVGESEQDGGWELEAGSWELGAGDPGTNPLSTQHSARVEPVAPETVVQVRAHQRVLHPAARRPLGHAIRKLLAGLPEPAQVEAVHEIARGGLSVREAEDLITARFRPVKATLSVGGGAGGHPLQLIADQVAADGLAVVKLLGLTPACKGRRVDRSLLMDALRRDLADLQVLASYAD